MTSTWSSSSVVNFCIITTIGPSLRLISSYEMLFSSDTNFIYFIKSSTMICIFIQPWNIYLHWRGYKMKKAFLWGILLNKHANLKNILYIFGCVLTIFCLNFHFFTMLYLYLIKRLGRNEYLLWVSYLALLPNHSSYFSLANKKYPCSKLVF